MEIFEIADINEMINKYYHLKASCIDYSVGADSNVYILFRTEVTGNAFLYNAVELEINWDCGEVVNVAFYELGRHTQTFNFIRQIGGDFLLVNSCCDYIDGEYEQNAMIVERDGSLQKHICLGDGIENCIVKADETIITGYCDEGIFECDAIGSPGLIAWDRNCNIIWENDPKKYEINDCYAINLDCDDNLWFYYYSDFKLVQTDFNSFNEMKSPVDFSHGFAMSASKSTFLFADGEDSFFMISPKLEGTKVIVTLNGEKVIIAPYSFIFNGDKLLFMTNENILCGYLLHD